MRCFVGSIRVEACSAALFQTFPRSSIARSGYRRRRSMCMTRTVSAIDVHRTPQPRVGLAPGSEV
jgi:hypothetical protein